MYSLLFGTLSLFAVTSQVVVSQLSSQNQSSVNSSGIVTKILSSNGTDLSSNFQTMVFEEQPRDTLANLTDRTVQWSREISSCRSPNAVFQYSYCRRHRSSASDMRAYTVVCKAPPPGPGYFSPRTVIEHGLCTFNELCMDGPKEARNRTRGSPGRALPTKASCIGKTGFIPATDFLAYQDQYKFNLWRHQQSGQLRFSFPDGSTPLNARNINVNTVGHKVTDREMISQDASCKDCSNLVVPTGGDENIDLLKTQATIQGATAGILWLAFMGGSAMVG